MRIIVPIKQILDPGGITVRRDRERIFVNREEYIIGQGSKAALEAALRLKEASDATVTAVSVGESRADDALREALAMGCDSAYLLCDPSFAEVDITGTTWILVAALEKLGGADLIVAGRQSADSAMGQIGPRLAGALGYAQVTDVWALSATGESVRCIRRWGDGFAAVSAPVPAVVSVAPEAFSPRLAHGARIMSAYREWDVPVWTAADLHLETGEPSGASPTGRSLVPLLALRSETFPPPLEVGEVFRGDPIEVARDVVIGLRQQRLLS